MRKTFFHILLRWRLQIAFISIVQCLAPSIQAAKTMTSFPSLMDESVRLHFDTRGDLWMPGSSEKDTPIHLTNVGLFFPVYKAEYFKVSLNIESESLGLGRPDFQLGEDNVYVSGSLRNAQTGVLFQYTDPSQSKWMAYVAGASASDEPKDSKDSRWQELDLAYWSAPVSGRRWMLGINHSHNRGFLNDKVFIYVGLMEKKSDELTVSYGLPFVKLNWKKSDDYEREFRWTPTQMYFSGEVNLEDYFRWRYLAEVFVKSYLHTHRVDLEDRLFYRELHFESGLEKDLSKETTVYFGAGYSMDRRVYEGKNLYYRGPKTLDLDNDLYLRVILEFLL